MFRSPATIIGLPLNHCPFDSVFDFQTINPSGVKCVRCQLGGSNLVKLLLWFRTQVVYPGMATKPIPWLQRVATIVSYCARRKTPTAERMNCTRL